MTTANTQLAFRTQKAVGIIDTAPVYEPLSGFERSEGTYRCCRYSPNGQYFAYAGEDVKVANPDNGEIVGTLPIQNVYDVGFSPLGSYLITVERPYKAEDGNAGKNLKVWRTSTLEEVASFVHKGGQEGWNLQYTFDEKYCARAVTNEIQFYEPDKMNTVWGHLRVEGVTDFALSPGKNYAVAVFVAEKKGHPAKVLTYNIPDFKNPLQQKNFFKADKCQLMWNALGTAVLALTQTEVDKTGKSYYGETNLYLLAPANNYDCRVSLDKEGPIHDVAWNPTSREFGVVFGYMPAKTTFFNLKANPTFSLPLAPRNTISFSPHGRFVLVGGFGNLQGQMDIYDREKNNAKIVTFEASNSSVCEWSPDGRHILTATTSPRLRVDNGVKIWHITGQLQYHEEMEELYNVYWRPQPTDAHPLAQQVPTAPSPHASAVHHVTTKTPVKPAGAYRPPHARGSATPLLFKREDEGGAAHVMSGVTNPNGGVNGFGAKGRRREVPGAAPVEAPATDDSQLSKSALKNKKKREAAKKKAEQEKATGQKEGGSPQADGASGDQREPNQNQPRQGRDTRTNTLANRRSDTRSRSRANQDSRDRRSKSRPNNGREGSNGNNNGTGHHRAGSASENKRENPKHLSPATIITDQSIEEGPLSPSPEEKKRRALHKKLRAIEDLKMRQASGEKLEDTQVKKIATEGEVRRDLEKLGFSG